MMKLPLVGHHKDKPGKEERRRSEERVSDVYVTAVLDELTSTAMHT